MAQIKATMNKTCATFPPITLSTRAFTLENNPINQIQKLDSVHDFGGTRGNNLATDSISKNRATSEYAYNQMRLSFIQKYSFPAGTPLGNQITAIPIQDYSNFSFPGAGQTPRIVDDVENFVLLSALQNAIITRGLTVETGNFLCRPIPKPDTFIETKTALATFFNSYIDTTGTGKINFIVDTPGDLTKVLKSDKAQNNFAYVLTQESAHDSAKGKPTTLSPIVIDEAYNGNGFCEAFGDNVNPARTYTFTADSNDPGTFESNFTITFNGMNFTKVNKEYFYTNVNYNKTGFNQDVSCPLNGLVHPTNVPQITKAVTELTKVSTLILQRQDKEILDPPNGVQRAADYINTFYTAFMTPSDKYNYSPENQNLLDFNFTKKRAGDGLQARICQYVNSGSIELNCYKKRSASDPPGNVEAGLYKGRVYSITKLILVTIDRVLFSYCVKNDIPAIYSGTDFFIFFKPNPPQNAGTVFNRRGGMSLLPLHIKTYSNKSARNQIIKSVKRGGIIQKGGDDVDDFYNVINDIPYIIFKLLPRILNNFKAHAPILLSSAIGLFQNITDEHITTYYDDKMPILIYADQLNTLSNGFPNTVTEKTIIYLSGGPGPITNCKIDRITSQAANVDYQFSSQQIAAFTFSKINITQIIGNVTGVITKSKLRALAGEIEVSSLLDSILSDFSIDDAPEDDAPQDDASQDDASQDGGKKQRGGDKKSLLDLYTINMVSSENLLNNDKIKEENLIALLSYINIFTCYEVSFCYDNEIYAQKFNNINGLEVTNNIGLYIMFDLLLKDFSEQKSKISYSLLEYFINSGDSSQKYLSISTDMMEILQYVYCDDVRLDESLNRKIEKQIQGQIISTSNPIFVESQTYYNTLFDRILAKQSEVQAYLDGTNVEPNIRNYITNNLSMYGFMNMVNDVVDSLLPSQSSSSSQGLASGLQAAYSSGEERKQQIESQRARFKRQMPTETQQQTKTGIVTLSGPQMPIKPQERKTGIVTLSGPQTPIKPQERKTGIVTLSDFPKRQEQLGQAIPVYAKSFGGKYRTNKNNRKNRKTRKNIKIIKKTRNIRKTKKQIIKRTRRH